MTFSLVCMEQIGLHLGLWFILLQFSDDVGMIRIHGNDEMKISSFLDVNSIDRLLWGCQRSSLNLSCQWVPLTWTGLFKKCVDKNYGIQQHLLHILKLFSQISFASPTSIKCFSLKQTCSPLKINGWKMIHFLLAQKAYFQGANLLSVSGSVAD